MYHAHEIVLASASPRRRQLLEQLGIEITVVPSQADETLLAEEDAETHVRRLSRDKAMEVARRPEVAGRWFIGSDTVVVLENRILGKPSGPDQARRMLESLSGKEHQVLSGYAIHDRLHGRTTEGCGRTRVWFRELTDREIAGYIASGEPLDKAGSYAIQGIGAFMVRAIEGSYTTVVGLPLCEIVSVLLHLGALHVAPASHR